MRFRTLAIVAALSAGLGQTGSAYAPQKGAETTVTAGRAARLHRDVTWQAPQGALAGLPGWRVIWDRDIDVPLRMWGAPLAAPGANGNALTAELAARKLLAEHLALLAPGARVDDFTLLANDATGSLRTVTFAQHAYGLRVLGGAVAFTFSHDNLIAIASTAIPNVAATVKLPGGPLSPSLLASSAKSWLAADGHTVDVKAYGERLIVPIVHARGRAPTPSIEYHVADSVTVESSSAKEIGRWDVWLDATSATPIARRSTLMFATGKVLFDTPDRYPGGVRNAKAAPEATHQLAVGAAAPAPVTSLVDGTITWADASNATVTPGLVGPRVKITNRAGALATDQLQLAPNGTVTWSRATDEQGDAQLISFVAASVGKQFARTRLPASAQLLAWLDGQIPVFVNENQTCNAVSSGNDIHFFRSNAQCENTGRITDVVYHEFGHSVHAQSVIAGLGSFDGAPGLSEGLADTLAAAITNDHGMGRGFFRTNQALRDLDPVGVEKRWPEDATGEPHDDGEIIGETLWDLRTNLETALGAEAGFEKFLSLYFACLSRAADIPSTYAEVLIADDDDGNLANGTPNQCAISEAFARHGLADPSLTLGLEPPVRQGYKISLTTPVPENDCPPPSVTAGTLTWKATGGTAVDVPLAATGNTWSANIPTQPDGTVVLYHVTLQLSDGSSVTYPQNPADPEYQFYAGNVETLWCADFENGMGDWVVAGTANRTEWEAGVPMGLGRDPASAHGGTGVLGIDLGTTGNRDGLYRARTTQSIESPEIDLQGNTGVRLQYWRWLTVEDGVFDQATISANDTVVWTNFASASPQNNGVNHTDKEWRFQDVDLSAHTAGGKIKLKFALESDPGLELGGWTVDDVCLVIAGPPSSHCGNNNLDEGETCDDGNTVDGDGCSATCTVDGESGDDEGGCCSASTNPAGALALAFLTLGFVVRRRRR
jgi:uncharacterized protein (TIGR03382 family)